MGKSIPDANLFNEVIHTQDGYAKKKFPLEQIRTIIAQNAVSMATWNLDNIEMIQTPSSWPFDFPNDGHETIHLNV
jgi:hypothetical protein